MGASGRGAPTPTAAYAGSKVRFFGTAGAAGAKNDYPYLDDGGTLFDPTDDVERRRQNADFLEGLGFANMNVDTSDKSSLDLVFLGVGRGSRRARSSKLAGAQRAEQDDAVDRLRLVASARRWGSFPIACR